MKIKLPVLKILTNKKGLTLIEIVLTIGIFSLVLYFVSVSFIKVQRGNILSDNTWQITAILREAQNRSFSGEAIGEDQLHFGVLFSQNSYREFATTSNYAARDLDFDVLNNLASILEFTNINLPDNCLQPNDCIIFSPIVGTPSASGSIHLRNKVDQAIKKISINSQGKVSF
ncbi:Tfp pilus assembly protein FimT/FimU [Patescibacteria group bacterium]